MAKRVLLSATDPGGAANLAPLVAPLIAARADVFVLTSPNLASRFDLEAANIMTGVLPEETSAVFERIAPSSVIVGTTRYDSPDRRLPQIAASSNIRSVAVLDERYLYRARFENGAGHVDVWPDAITLLDEASVGEAIAEGLPAERLHVTGSPALAELVSTIESLHSAPPPRPAFLGDEPLITFISETLTADYGTSADPAGPIGAFVGYTEESVLGQLVDLARQLNVSLTLIDKRHPADEREIGTERIIDRVRLIPVRDQPLWTLLWHSRAVIGMRSMALLEAAIMGVPALSFQPGLIGPERCTAVRIGMIPQTTSAAEAREWLAGVLQAAMTRRERPQTKGFAPSDAAQRIVELALDEGR